MLVKRHLSPLVKLCSQKGPEASQNWLIQSANLHSIRLHEAINVQVTFNFARSIEVLRQASNLMDFQLTIFGFDVFIWETRLCFDIKLDSILVMVSDAVKLIMLSGLMRLEIRRLIVLLT